MTSPHAAKRLGRVAVGIALGLVISAAILPLLERENASPPSGALLSECDGEIQELVIHYVRDAADTVAPIYRNFLPLLPEQIAVHVVCPEEADFADLRSRVGPTACRLSPVVVGHPITAWARDRWLALEPVKQGDPVTLLAPREEAGADIWPARAGDQRVADDLAARIGAVRAERSELFFDGGDFVSDDETVFVNQAAVRRNVQQTVQTEEELVERLGHLLKRRVVLLRDAPDHHAGMFMMVVGERTVLVGDPVAGCRLLESARSDGRAVPSLPGGADCTEATAARFEAVARQCEAAGYRVVRIPVAPGSDGRTYLSYVNAIIDRRAGQRIVYMPVFRGAEPLNDAATAVWQSLGYEVRPIDCTACYSHFGTLQCLVNVLRR